jgi:hypothetical protein
METSTAYLPPLIKHDDKRFNPSFVFEGRQHIYLIVNEAAGAVKIGISKNVLKRLNALQSANADKLFLYGYFPNAGLELEQKLHNLFKNQKIRGEWYKIDVLKIL